MPSHRPLSDTRHFKLLKRVHEAGKVPCEPYPELFFPEDIADPELRDAYTKTAKALCQTCPILEHCFTYAMERGERYGIWGGTTPNERI
jgi:WhiB family redox-sensing transcriptional regulator